MKIWSFSYFYFHLQDSQIYINTCFIFINVMVMKLKSATICLLLVSAFASANNRSVDVKNLKTTYQDLMDKPNTIERQKAYFDAFPGTWEDFISTYRYSDASGYDLSMYNESHNHIQVLSGRVTLLPDSVYCRKLVNIAVGASLSADAPSHFQELLHRVMWKRMDGMLREVAKLRRGYQMQFWQFYWSSPLSSKDVETEYQRLLKLNADAYPQQMETMKIAYNYFYNGINIDGGYQED